MEQTVIVQGATFSDLLERIGLIAAQRVEKALKEAIITQKSHRYLSRVEVAQKLKISLPTLNDWTKLGLLTFY